MHKSNFKTITSIDNAINPSDEYNIICSNLLIKDS